MEPTPWIDQVAYPFASHFLRVPGGQLHYIDEGQGESLLFVHGTPTWSFLWRHQIKALSGQYRCVALDHLGFGLSDKPQDFSYALADHQQNLAWLAEHLGLERVTLVVHDFGGPIDLGWALQNPSKIARVVVLNSWMWPLTEEKTMMRGSRFFATWVGKFLYQTLNFPTLLLPLGFAKKENLSKALHAQYLGPFEKKKDRAGPWHFAKALAQETAYFHQLFDERQKLQTKPLLVLWGTQDKLLPLTFLEKWRRMFPDAKIEEIPVGHFVQEEASEHVTSALQEFMASPLR